jgi:hypothetical protein
VHRPAILTSARSPHPKLRRWRRRAFEMLQYPLIAAVALGAAYTAVFGQWVVLGYAVIAFALRRPSRLSFGLALFILTTVPLFSVLGQPGIAQNAAIYVYELLLFGTVQVIFEHRKIAKTPN